jgi:membrane protein YdbS with pleckstrin-like domain
MRRKSIRYLAVDERLVMQIRKHPWVLGQSFLEALAAMVGATLIGFILSPDRNSDLIDTIVGLVAVVFALRFAYRLWNWWDNRVLVTNQRIVEASGVITRRVASMPLSKVTDMTYRRTIFGRLLGYGDLVLESAGQHQALERIDHIPDPDHFYRTVTALVTAKVGGPPPVRQAEQGNDEDDTGPIPRVIV